MTVFAADTPVWQPPLFFEGTTGGADRFLHDWDIEHGKTCSVLALLGPLLHQCGRPVSDPQAFSCAIC